MLPFENVFKLGSLNNVYGAFVLRRGKGDYFRLGHGSDAHVRKPQMVEALKGKKIVHVAVGALHCLAVTDTGQVRSRGRRSAALHGIDRPRVCRSRGRQSNALNCLSVLGL